jgi:hypothetical protein
MVINSATKTVNARAIIADKVVKDRAVLSTKVVDA